MNYYPFEVQVDKRTIIVVPGDNLGIDKSLEFKLKTEDDTTSTEVINSAIKRWGLKRVDLYVSPGKIKYSEGDWIEQRIKPGERIENYLRHCGKAVVVKWRICARSAKV